ncbi:reverse transcriptase domain-containing protein [Tanacetum coccineum]
MNIRMSRLRNSELVEKDATTLLPSKHVEEFVSPCGFNHNFNNCPLTRNEFPVFHDNIINFNKRRHSASTSNSGTLPSQTVTNHRQQINAITIRSGKTLEGPSTPLVPIPVVLNPQKEPEQNPKTSTEKVQNPNLENTAHVPLREDRIHFHEIPNQKQMKLPEKLEDPRKFLIPCALQELDRTSALADSRASINLLPHSIYKQLGLEALTPTRMTLELPLVNFEPDPRVPIILGRPFLRTAKALIDLYEETLTLRVGKEDLVYYADKSEKNKNKHFVNAISFAHGETSDNVEKFADELAPLDSLPPGNDDSTLKKDVQEGNFQVYLNPLFEFDDNFKSSTINPFFDEMEEDVKIKNSNVSDEPVLLNTPLSDKVECFAPEDNNVNTDAFLLWKFSSILGKVISSQNGRRENRASWLDKLDDALWAFRTAYKTSIICTPYKLVYGKSCHLPVELEHKAYWALKHANFDLKTAGDHRKLQLNELNELRDQAYENSLIYKEKTKKLHDSKIKNRIFNVGDQVLIFNSRLKIFSGKLKSRWSGPFIITEVFPYGTAKLSHPDGSNFKVNCHRLKHYYGGDTPPLVIPDLQTFPKDN